MAHTGHLSPCEASEVGGSQAGCQSCLHSKDFTVAKPGPHKTTTTTINEILSLAITWIDLGDTVLREINQAHKAKYYMTLSAYRI